MKLRQADTYWVHSIPARSDIIEARLEVNKAAKELFERFGCWPSHLGFGKFAHGQVTEFFRRVGAKELPLTVPFGEVWLAYPKQGGWQTQSWEDMPDWARKPSDDPRLARHIGKKRKHPKSTMTKKYKKPTKGKAKKDKAKIKDWESSVVRRTEKTRPSIELRYGKHSDRWYGLLSNTIVVGDLLGVEGEHVLHSLGESGLSHYYLLDDTGQRHEIPANYVIPYGKASEQLAELACKPADGRLPDMNKVMEAIDSQVREKVTDVIEIG